MNGFIYILKERGGNESHFPSYANCKLYIHNSTLLCKTVYPTAESKDAPTVNSIHPE
uniref:Uncharacterized protein n=1 Tax=Anguilla anguilla TaxID=7936 RepID=A0A0E9XBB8_ANGAN